MTQAPCKNCADRAVGCHGLCKAYNDWAHKYRHELEMEKKTMPRQIRKLDFTGTSPKPGHHRRTRNSKC